MIAATGDVAVGGGLVLEDYNLVVTQPAEGDFRGFSATCTHQGCLVSEVNDGTIDCLCHGSKFSIEDGSVVQAAQGLSADEQPPLPQAGIIVNGDSIELPA
jgi:Rieske Fe-S protein